MISAGSAPADHGSQLAAAPLQDGISVVIPVYNSALSLPQLMQGLKGVLGGLHTGFEIVLVDDASTDGSWEAILGLACEYPMIRAFQLMRNYGQHNGLLCGIRQARFSTIVTMDDDLQNPPDQIPALLAKLGEGYDVVYGVPERQQHGLWRDLSSTVSKIVLSGAMGAAIARDVSAFRAFRASVREAFRSYDGPYVSIDVLLTWGTTRFAAVRVRHDPRTLGTSGYTFRRLVSHALNMMTGFSTVPLRFASITGFVFTAFGLAVLAFVIFRYLLEGNPVPGFPFLASQIAIFSGAQLFALGIIGEYLARMHFRSMERPTYVVRSDLGSGGAAKGAS